MSKRVLLVEDNPDEAKLYGIALASLLYDVVFAADGAEALVKLQRKPVVDAVLLDAKLPGVSGLELMKMMRGDAALASIPVVIMSGDDSMVKLGLSAGAVAGLVKPISFEDLISKIKSALYVATVKPESV